MMFLDEGDPRREVWTGCESPIEQYLCCAMFSYLGCKAVAGPFDESRLAQLAELSGDKPACFLFSQHSIGIYRADFLLVVIDPQRRVMRRLAIECDGRRYHSKDRDRRRDAEIGEAGYRVVRFTGTEIHKRMPTVIRQVAEWIEGCGAVCERGLIAGWLDRFDPNSEPAMERRRQRYEALEATLREEEQEARRWRPDFICEDGTPGRWADAL